MYEYECIIERIVDGDTVDVSIDLGFDIWLHNERVRLCSIDAPESRTRDLEEKERGIESTAFLEKLLPVGSRQRLISKQFKGKFGRVLGDFKVYDSKIDAENEVTEIMLREGHAVQYVP